MSSDSTVLDSVASLNDSRGVSVAGSVCFVIQAALGGAINGNSEGTPASFTEPKANFTC